MPTTQVPKGAQRFSEHEGDILEAQSLGTGIALIIKCQKTGITALAHIPFPDSRIDPGQGTNQPGLFVDTAVDRLLQAIRAEGSPLKTESTTVILVGGAGIKNVNPELDTGSRNIEAVQQQIRDQGLSITSKDLGRNLNRTVTVDPGLEAIKITAPGQKAWYL